MTISTSNSVLVEYEPNKILTSKRAASSWQPRRPNVRVAARLRSLKRLGDSEALVAELDKLAGSCGNCGQPHLACIKGMPTVLPMKCRKALLCRSCKLMFAFANAPKDAARVLTARRENPDLCFAHLTLTVPVMDDLEEQLDLIVASRAKLIRMELGGVAVVKGMISHIHIAPGWGGTWRAHLHAIVAVSSVDVDLSEVIFKRWIKLTMGDASFEERERALASQHLEAFYSHHRAGFSAPKMAVAVGQDAYAISHYGGKGHCLSIESQFAAYGYISGRLLRAISGVFRGYEPAALKAIVDSIGLDVLSGRRISIRTRSDTSVSRRFKFDSNLAVMQGVGGTVRQRGSRPTRKRRRVSTMGCTSQCGLRPRHFDDAARDVCCARPPPGTDRSEVGGVSDNLLPDVLGVQIACQDNGRYGVLHRSSDAVEAVVLGLVSTGRYDCSCPPQTLIKAVSWHRRGR